MRVSLFSCLLLAGCSNSLHTSINVEQIIEETLPTDDNAPVNDVRERTIKELVREDGLALGLYKGPNGWPWHAICVSEDLEAKYREDPIDTLYELMEIVETGSVDDARTAGGLAWALVDGFGGGTAAANFSVDEETREFYRSSLPSWIEETEFKYLNSRCGTVPGGPYFEPSFYVEE